MKKIAFIANTDRGITLGLSLQKEYPKSVLVSTRSSEFEEVSQVTSLSDYLAKHFDRLDGICFIGALGIAVRLIAPHLQDKHQDPAVICVDDLGIHVQSVLSGHVGGANDFTKKVAQVTGGKAIISTSSDLQSIWALDVLASQYNWTLETEEELNKVISLFVNSNPTALLLNCKDVGTQYLEKTLPEFVQVFYNLETVPQTEFKLLIVVSPFIYETSIPTLYYRPKVLHIGSGCSKELDHELFEKTLREELADSKLAFSAVHSFGSVDIKAEQGAYLDFTNQHQLPFRCFTKDELNNVNIPNPSEVVQRKIGVGGVSEASALLLSGNDKLLVEKQKIHLDNGQKFTYAVALDKATVRQAQIVIVGAGPGGEELITVKGKNYLETADCVLYAGSLVPEEMLTWCKDGAIIRNSASMTLEEQLDLMVSHYQKGHLIVRLHSGDPSIYGAIQEQMTLFDELKLDYEIVPGISSFNAAAAILKSEFTIPEVVQTIIITRGEGKTPLPAAEKLEEMAKLQATICLFLSAGLAKKVEGQLLAHYTPDTPIAILYRATWKDEEVYTGELKDLAKLVKASKKTRTVLIIVGHAIGARKNRSQLYSPEWKHIFRTNKKFVVKA